MFPVIVQTPTASPGTLAGLPSAATFSTNAFAPLLSPQTSEWRAFIQAIDSGSIGGAPNIVASVRRLVTEPDGGVMSAFQMWTRDVGPVHVTLPVFTTQVCL